MAPEMRLWTIVRSSLIKLRRLKNFLLRENLIDRPKELLRWAEEELDALCKLGGLSQKEISTLRKEGCEEEGVRLYLLLSQSISQGSSTGCNVSISSYLATKNT